MEKIKIEDVENTYAIDYEDGTMVIGEVNDNSMFQRHGTWGYRPTVFVNSKINILSNGVLMIEGILLSWKLYNQILNDGITSSDVPTQDLEDGWSDNIFYNKNEDVYIGTKYGKNWLGIPKVVDRNAKILKRGYYLSTTGDKMKYTTSNYTLIENGKKKGKGLING